jgi:DNA-binding transcriptional MerR regulator
MALNEYKPQKLYYSIKEVAEMFGLNESTLRYWETEFPHLKPKTNGPAKIRQYQERDIEQLRTIYTLVKERGFKLAAAKKILNANRKGADMKAEVLTRLIAVRDDLQALKKQLDYVE